MTNTSRDEDSSAAADDHGPQGRPLALDAEADSAIPGTAAFLARPAGSPVYHGFRVLEDVAVDGFVLGMITNWESQPSDDGDAFVIAPDGSRCGLVWAVAPSWEFSEVCPIEPNRWGVWAVPFPFPMSSGENARKNLAATLPLLIPRWEEWKRRFASGAAGSPVDG